MVTMVKQIITDEELTLKRQARRRLVGAIALTIMVVVLLPMVLDREPPAPTKDIELQVPDKDKAGEFVPKMALPPLNATEAASQPASAPVIAPLLNGQPASGVVPPVAAATPAPVAEPAVAPKPEAATKPAPVAAAPVAPKVEPKVTQPEPQPKVAAKPAAKPAAKAAGKTHSGFVVQVGAFANAAAAKKLQEKLHKQGYPSYTEKIGNKVRVRIGDYATHTEADKIRRKLEIQGMQPDVLHLH